MQRLLILCFLLLLTGHQAAFAAAETGIFDVHSRPAADIAKALRPVLGDKVAISTFGNKVLIKATASKLDEARWLIRSLDVPAARLLIEVSSDKRLARQTPGWMANTRSKQDVQHQVQVLEGEVATLLSGESVPIFDIAQSQQGRTIQQSVRTRHQKLLKGIRVRPRLQDDNVTLEILQQHDQADRVKTLHFQHQQLITTVRGKLGEWIPLAGTAEQDTRQQRTRSTRHSDALTLYARVTRLN